MSYQQHNLRNGLVSLFWGTGLGIVLYYLGAPPGNGFNRTIGISGRQADARAGAAVRMIC